MADPGGIGSDDDDDDDDEGKGNTSGAEPILACDQIDSLTQATQPATWGC